MMYAPEGKTHVESFLWSKAALLSLQSAVGDYFTGQFASDMVHAARRWLDDTQLWKEMRYSVPREPASHHHISKDPTLQQQQFEHNRIWPTDRFADMWSCGIALPHWQELFGMVVRKAVDRFTETCRLETTTQYSILFVLMGTLDAGGYGI
jgi:hypothetical protein